MLRQEHPLQDALHPWVVFDHENCSQRAWARQSLRFDYGDNRFPVMTSILLRALIVTRIAAKMTIQ